MLKVIFVYLSLHENKMPMITIMLLLFKFPNNIIILLLLLQLHNGIKNNTIQIDLLFCLNMLYLYSIFVPCSCF